MLQSSFTNGNMSIDFYYTRRWHRFNKLRSVRLLVTHLDYKSMCARGYCVKFRNVMKKKQQEKRPFSAPLTLMSGLMGKSLLYLFHSMIQFVFVHDVKDFWSDVNLEIISCTYVILAINRLPANLIHPHLMKSIVIRVQFTHCLSQHVPLRYFLTITIE